LVSAIVLYDAIHKVITFSPLLIAFCRFLLYLAAASSARQGITGLTLWSALALAADVVGLSYLARRESVPQAVRYWPCSLLAAPVVLALLANGGPYWNRAVLLAVILGTWVIRCLGHAFSSNTRNVGRAVSGLLAGIVLVDLLAVAGGTPFVGFLFLVFFGAALLLQRVVPAK
jgi:4-hydroxybenzoate polyprenyltransferase